MSNEACSKSSKKYNVHDLDHAVTAMDVLTLEKNAKLDGFQGSKVVGYVISKVENIEPLCR